jgi:AhpC/TSA family
VTAPWIVAFGLLWGVVVLVAYTMVGVLRRVTAVLEVMEETRVEGAGAAVGSAVEPFDLYDDRGEVVRWQALVKEPTLVLFLTTRCTPCDAVLTDLRDVGSHIEGVPLVGVITDSDEARSHDFPQGLRVLFQRDEQATRAFDNRAYPQAYVVDSSGLVLARRIVRYERQLAELARSTHRPTRGIADEDGRAETASVRVSRES